MNKYLAAGILLATMTRVTPAQTRIDLRTQGKGADFSSYGSTKPAKAGTILPATCSIGELFFKTDGPAGENLYGCTSTNTWTVQAGGGAGVVSSVFGRVGAVSAQNGDYSFSQLSGTASNAQIAAGLDAGKIGTGTVDNNEFGHLEGVTSPIQTQLSGKASSSHSHILAGDVTGGVGGTTVVSLRSRNLASTAPQDGQALVWNASLSQWEPQNQTSSSANASQIHGRNISAAAPIDGQVLLWSAANGQWEPGAAAGGGATSASQLADLAVVRTSGTSLIIGPDCSTANPCNLRFGNITYSYTSSATATITAGTGAAFIYVTPDGSLIVGHNIAVTCSGCTAASPVSAFPPESIPLFTWTATSGTWDAAGGSDQRAMLSTKTILGGTGVVVSESAGESTVSIDSAVVSLRVAVPATTSSPCATGSWAADASYFYVCTTADTWRRTALSAW
jgi:hypothetical protein